MRRRLRDRLASCHEQPTRGSSRREDPFFLSPRALLYSLKFLHVNDQAKGRIGQGRGGEEGEREAADLSLSYGIKVEVGEETGKQVSFFKQRGRGEEGCATATPSPLLKLLAVLYLAYGFYDNETFFFPLSLSFAIAARSRRDKKRMFRYAN